MSTIRRLFRIGRQILDLIRSIRALFPGRDKAKPLKRRKEIQDDLAGQGDTARKRTSRRWVRGDKRR